MPLPSTAGMADAVAVAEGLGLGGQRVAVLAPDRRHAGQGVVGRAGAIDGRLQPRAVGRERHQHHVDVGRAERRLPVPGAALADVAQRPARAAMPCRNSQAKVSSDSCGTPSALRPLVGERDADPGLAERARRVGGRGHHGARAAASAPARARGRRCGTGCRSPHTGRPGAEHPALDVVELELGVGRLAHRNPPPCGATSPRRCSSRRRAGSRRRRTAC